MSLTGLPGLFPMPSPLYLIENLVFKDKIINIDGYHFKNCAFVNCTIQTSTGNFAIEACYFNGWWATFMGNALKVVKLSRILDWTTDNSGFNPIIAPDNAVTIKRTETRASFFKTLN